MSQTVDPKIQTAVMLPVFLVELGQLRVTSMTLKTLIESPHLRQEGKDMVPALKVAVEFCDSVARTRLAMISELMPKDQIFPAAITFLVESLQASLENKDVPPVNTLLEKVNGALG